MDGEVRQASRRGLNVLRLSLKNVFLYPWSLESSRGLLIKKELVMFSTQEKCEIYRINFGIKRDSC